MRPMTSLGEDHALHVLVVEDDRMLCRLVELVLTRKGWAVTCAPDGHAALDLLRTDPPDVLLLDLMLPDTSGFDVLDWIEKTNPSWLPHVIVFTAASCKVIEGLERKHHIGRIVRKPFDITELVNSIASCADEGAGAPLRDVQWAGATPQMSFSLSSRPQLKR